VLRVVAGPRDDRFAPAALDVLCRERWTVSPASNRIGVRLDGPALERVRDDELPSEGMVAGALQVPPSGRPILLGPDHPTTGGYPVVATVVSADLWRAGQLRPGDGVRFALSAAPR
jgi:allophanate hydrolase subunit 2